MPAVSTVPTKIAGDVFTATMWNTYIRDNVNKLGIQMHRQLSVAAFLALTGLEDGDEVYVEVDATNGTNWHLRYDLASTKWRFLGGAALRADIATDETTSTASFTDLTTIGPSATAPLLGDYQIEIGANAYVPSNGLKVGLKVGAAAVVDPGDTTQHGSGDVTASPGSFMARSIVKTAVAASTVLKEQYMVTNVVSTAHFRDRSIAIVPRRVG